MSDNSAEYVFNVIYREGWWGSKESVSGKGSEFANTVAMRRELAAWLARHPEVRTLLDAPCGDFNWMRYVQLDAGLQYIGIDIVEDLIKRNRKAYGSARHRFLCADITAGEVPPADAWLCRDALIHMPFAAGRRVVEHFLASSARWLLATTFPKETNVDDIAFGQYRKVNMSFPPFDLGPPAEIFADPAENNQDDRFVGIWRNPNAAPS